MTAVDWEAFQKCPVCFAELGKPCLNVSGWHLASIVIQAEAPHTGRKPRAGNSRG